MDAPLTVWIALTTCFACASWPAAASEGDDTVAAEARPAPRSDRNSMRAHEQLLAKARRGRIDVYFVGDSITRRWGASDRAYAHLLAHWRQSFFSWNAANFAGAATRCRTSSGVCTTANSMA